MSICSPPGGHNVAVVSVCATMRALLFSTIVPTTLICSSALAQQGLDTTQDLPILVVTPYRIPLLLERSGTAVTVIGPEQIASWGSKSIADALRGSPGVDISENGGPGSVSNLSLRGSNPGQTLVLIDGVRIGDASNIDGSFDFGTFSAQNVERIEILRGPQSALYGSDAMGGVVNIITRKGTGKPKTILALEGGSYGTISSNLSTFGSTDKLSYAFSIQGFHTDGFSRYGYRIGRITGQQTGPLERDKTDKTGASASVAYRPSSATEVSIGFRTYSSSFRFDNPGAFFTPQDTRFNKGRQNVTLGFAKFSHEMLDGKLKNSLRIFGTLTNRFNRLEQSCFDTVFNSYDCGVRFKSQRAGMEYQGDLKLGPFGLLVFGARSEREQASGTEQWLAPISPLITTFKGAQVTNSGFALYQINAGQWSLSAGGRIDTIDGKETFPTWRATIVYRLAGAGTKLRASAGTGAKAPTLFQRFSQYGTPGLQAETNTGYEIGIDQSLWNGRAKFSITAFDTSYRNLIGFNFALNNGQGGYFNIGRAKIQGVEASGDVILVPQAWRMRAAYTYMQAIDTINEIPLLRRPKHKGFVSLIYSGIPNVMIEGRVTYIGSRIDIANNFPYARVKLAEYGKFDGRISYKVSENISLFARVENITNARYQEIRDYGVAGRSYFAGAKVTW